MYEFDDDNEYEIVINKPRNSFKNRGINKKKILIIIGIIFMIIIIGIIIKVMISPERKYERMERKLVNSAKKYIEDNNIVINKEIFLDSKKIDVVLDEECLLTSGVIYDGSTYTPYLKCQNYESDVYRDKSRNMELKGKSLVVIPKGVTYYDPGYQSMKDIEVVGEVGTEAGVYNITYVNKGRKETLTRKVIVVDNEELYELFPKITLKGNYIEYIELNSKYKDEGVIVFDLYDSNIDDKIEIEDEVVNDEEGEYIIIYSVTNSNGYTNSIIRKVNVVSDLKGKKVMHALVPEQVTGLNVTIVLSIIDSDMDYVELPNRRSTKNRYITYEVSENGEYEFIIHEKDGSIYNELVKVDNIKKEKADGGCVATWKKDYTLVEVNVKSNTSVSSYDYIINNKTEKSSISTSYRSNIIKPEKVKVRTKDNFGNVTIIDCEISDKTVPEIVTDAKGKNCLEGHICYIQFDYQSSKYPYCSMSGNPNSCGGIGRNGCSITSTSIAIANLGVRSSNGEIYNPFTVWEELYPFSNKSTGECNGGCSAWTRMRDAVINSGLSAPKVEYTNRELFPKIIAHLKNGYPVIVHAGEGPFAKKGHYMAFLALREEDNYVYLSDPALTNGIMKDYYNGKQYYADTWISLDDMISGNIDTFLLVGPPGYF